jgi:hypothetical protein
MQAVTIEEIPQHDTGRIRLPAGESTAYNATGRTIPSGSRVGVKPEAGELRIVAVIR